MKCSKFIGIAKYENKIIIFLDVEAWKQDYRHGLVTRLVLAVKYEY